MRLAVISDTHLPRGTRELPARLIAECRAADLILHAGDFTAVSVLVELELLGPVAAVCGNCDDESLVAHLPVERVVEAAGARIGMVHDSGPSDGRGARMRTRFPDCHAVVFGHSHLPLLEQVGELLLLNPGSAIERRRAPTCTMALVDVTDGRLHARLIDLP
jgi:putative phosphoesterase